MRIESTTFCAITINGKTYEHDVVIRLSGEVVKRKEKLSRKLYGTSHVLSKDEAKFLFEKGGDQIVIASGEMDNVRLSSEAEAYFKKKGCEVLLKPTPEAIRMFNQSRARRIGLFHVASQPVAACSRIKALRKLYQTKSSETRGLLLMRDWLSPDQREQFDNSGYFDVVGCDSGKRYRIYHGMAPPNVYEIDDAGRLKMGLCFMPIGRLVAGDVILVQKIALETDEDSALKVANRILPNREWLCSRSL
jgi:hypothetical protein